MQTISVPYTVDEAGAAILAGWRHRASRVVRSAYRAAATFDEATGKAAFADERLVRDAMKARFPCGPGSDGRDDPSIDSWIVHCATREGFALRAARPDGRMVFGGRKHLRRRQDELIAKDEWRAKRLRPLTTIGDKTHKGNRHVRLASDARSATVAIYGVAVTMALTAMRGKWDALLRAVARLAAAGEVSVTFRIGRTLDVSFEELDLRRLPEGVSLQEAKDRDLAISGRKGRGRPRGPGYVASGSAWTPEDPRPVHPEWRDPVAAVQGRCLGVDMNPRSMGLTVVENGGDLRSLAETRILDHRLVEFGLPTDATDEVVREALAKVCNLAIAQARAWGAGAIAVEDGLGRLRSATRSRAANRLINGWCRTAFVQMLTRRARLAGLKVLAVWAGYSTTIGNIGFPLPDACAAAGEIARRGLLAATGVRQGLLPTCAPRVAPGLWKDRALLAGGGILRDAASWVEAHRGLKKARLGVRRPHPQAPPAGPDPRPRIVDGYALRRLGHVRRPGTVFVPVGATG